jgi:hypothetical protein
MVFVVSVCAYRFRAVYPVPGDTEVKRGADVERRPRIQTHMNT